MLALTLFACTGADPEDGGTTRAWDLHDHAPTYRAARDAVFHQDLGAARKAAARIAPPDPEPGLPPEPRSSLAAIRARATRMSGAPTLESAAADLVAMTADCADCHRQLRAPLPAATDDPRDLVWIGLEFESEARWQAGIAKLHDPGLSGVTSWADRRSAIAAVLPRGRP